MAKDSLAKSKSRKGAAKTPAKAATPAERRAALQDAGKPILQASSAILGQSSFLALGDEKGDVLTWKTPDGATFSQRNGVLIQTRGLGADLMSAQVPSVGQLRAGETYQRIYYFLGGDDQGTKRTYDCTSTVVGEESIDVLGRTSTTTHVAEVCQRPPGTLNNDYWIEGGTIRKSRQWVSGPIGYVEFARVID